MSQASFYESQLGFIWWFVMARIGQDLRERYEIPQELPSKLLVLVGKLDPTEGNYSLRYVPPLERRGLDESDWLPPSFVWQNDRDLFLS